MTGEEAAGGPRGAEPADGDGRGAVPAPAAQCAVPAPG